MRYLTIILATLFISLCFYSLSLAADATGTFDLSALQNLFSEFWWTVVLAIIGLFSIVAMFLPSPDPSGNKIYAALYYFCQWCAANALHARNAQDIKPIQLKKYE